jgi:formamidopyrimidine-DNA glycosylase
VPELPEVENARQVVEKALDRVITGVDDRDEFVCRPHHPGEIDQALKGGRLTAAHRRGKTMWCDTVTADGEEGPHLGIHLGMGGRIFVTGPSGDAESLYAGGDPHVGGMPEKAGERPGTQPTKNPRWDRVRITFDDGGELRLFDKRRLGRVRLDPDIDSLGPDAEEISLADFRERVRRGTAPVKARLMDQAVLAGIGNLLADEVLWQAEVSPTAESGQLSECELTRLHRELHNAVRSAIEKGGSHTGEVIPYRRADAHCPRCGAPMRQGKVGGRTTWWCSREQQ